MKYYLAVDIGASSGKMLLGHIDEGRFVLEEIHRFANNLIHKDGHLCWDIENLFSSIVQGLKNCKELGKIPATMGIDTWGVDFVLLDKEYKILGNSVAYRDSRTERMDKWIEERLSAEELYARTGIQKQPYNTIYQLAAVKKENPEHLENAEFYLMIPEYLNFLLTGKCLNEYTNATSTGLVNAKEKTWDKDIIPTVGYPEKLFRPLVMPGTEVGSLMGKIQKQVGFSCTVVLPATHDTGSAFLAVPAKDDNAITLSSGTWSLLGVENVEPITTEQSRILNFTNEGGYDYRFRYLKNIMGLWMIQSIRRNLNKVYSFAQLEQMAKESADFPSVVDVNDQAFFAPDNMMDAVKETCRKTGQQVPQTVGEIMQCVYQSLSISYANAIKGLEDITQKKYTRIHIVGGGSKDGYLNSLTAKKTGLSVFAGPEEGTALGNLMAQMIRAGEFSDLFAARKAIHNSFNILNYT
ncbi:MAG TPA: rhamnulokinase [Ruminococcaceae bacterium]|nr:rhamnulokinase [Oscillospiraceae bacterium]